MFKIKTFARPILGVAGKAVKAFRRQNMRNCRRSCRRFFWLTSALSHWTLKDFPPFTLTTKFLGQNCTFSSLAANLSRISQCFQHGKGVSLVSWYEDTKSFTPSPKIGFWPQTGLIGPKTGIFGYIWAFLAHLILFPTKKTMQTSCLGGFFVIWVPKLLLTPIEIRIFGP